jgi:hypothetical protein
MRPERIDSAQMRSGDRTTERRGLGLHRQSGIIGQGVRSRGELKRLTARRHRETNIPAT